MLSRRLAALPAIFLGILSTGAYAQDNSRVFEYSNNWSPWTVGSVSNNQCWGSMCAQLKILPTGSPETINVVVEFYTSYKWCGGMRLTPNENPTTTHNSIRLNPGTKTKWNEIMPAGTTRVYLLLRQDQEGKC